MIDAKGIFNELNKPTWKSEVKPKRMQGIRADGVEMKPMALEESEKYRKSNINDYFKSNRERFINKLSNRQLARLIDCFTDWHEEDGCKEFCPLYNKFYCNSEFCVDKIEKWLGEKA